VEKDEFQERIEENFELDPLFFSIENVGSEEKVEWDGLFQLEKDGQKEEDGRKEGREDFEDKREGQVVVLEVKALLSEGEEVYKPVRKGASNDKFKVAYFVKLGNNSDVGEVYKCRICKKRFSKTRETVRSEKVVGKEKEKDGEERKKDGEKNINKRVRFKNEIFYCHLAENHSSTLSILTVDDLPNDKDALLTLRRHFEEKKWSGVRKEVKEKLEKAQEEVRVRKRKKNHVEVVGGKDSEEIIILDSASTPTSSTSSSTSSFPIPDAATTSALSSSCLHEK